MSCPVVFAAWADAGSCAAVAPAARRGRSGAPQSATMTIAMSRTLPARSTNLKASSSDLDSALHVVVDEALVAVRSRFDERELVARQRRGIGEHDAGAAEAGPVERAPVGDGGRLRR